MKITTTNYGIQVKFTEKDPTIHYDGVFISNNHVAFKPIEAIRVAFDKKESRTLYKAHTSFSIQKHICTPGKCRYDLQHTLSVVETEQMQELIATKWSGLSCGKFPVTIYHNRSAGTFAQINSEYAILMEKLIGNSGRFMISGKRKDLVLAYRQDELVGGVMLVTFASGECHMNIENI